MGKTAAERQAEYRQRMRDEGFKQVLLWVHPDDRDKLKAYADKLLKARDTDKK